MKKVINKLLLFFVLFLPICAHAADYLLCGNDKKLPLAFAEVMSVVYVIIKLIVPILMVIMGIVSFFKAIFSGKVDDELEKAKQGLIHKIIAAIVIYFLVSIVNFVIALAVGKDNSFSSCLSCMINPDNCEQVDSELARLCPGLLSQQENYDANCKYLGPKGEYIDYGDTGDTGIPNYVNEPGYMGQSLVGPSGEYTTWRQSSPEWGGRTYGPGATLANVGCNLTSIAIQIKRSGIPTVVSPFNPGTLFDFMKARGYLSSGGSTLNYAAFNQVAPGFEYDGMKNLSSNDKVTYDILSGLLKDKKYPIVHVKSNNGKPFATRGHYVAAVGFTEDDIVIVDPANTNCTRLFTCKPELDRSNGYLMGKETSYWRGE